MANIAFRAGSIGRFISTPPSMTKWLPWKSAMPFIDGWGPSAASSLHGTQLGSNATGKDALDRAASASRLMSSGSSISCVRSNLKRPLWRTSGICVPKSSTSCESSPLSSVVVTSSVSGCSPGSGVTVPVAEQLLDAVAQLRREVLVALEDGRLVRLVRRPQQRLEVGDVQPDVAQPVERSVPRDRTGEQRSVDPAGARARDDVDTRLVAGKWSSCA